MDYKLLCMYRCFLSEVGGIQGEYPSAWLLDRTLRLRGQKLDTSYDLFHLIFVHIILVRFTFWGRAAYSVDHTFSLYMYYVYL